MSRVKLNKKAPSLGLEMDLVHSTRTVFSLVAVGLLPITFKFARAPTVNCAQGLGGDIFSANRFFKRNCMTSFGNVLFDFTDALFALSVIFP